MIIKSQNKDLVVDTYGNHFRMFCGPDGRYGIETRAGVLKEAEDVKKEAKTSFYLQYMGKEISTEEITKKVHEVWTKEYGKSVEEIKTLNVYLKPEEAAAYYVINEETTGKVTI